MQEATLVFLRRGDDVLLGLKKRGYGEGRWNGIGGKVEEGETVDAALLRECREEIGVQLLTFRLVGTLAIKHADMLVHVFVATDFEGDPQESDEMQPRWFSCNAIPYDDMWPTDRLWLPPLLQSETNHQFVFTVNGE